MLMVYLQVNCYTVQGATITNFVLNQMYSNIEGNANNLFDCSVLTAL